MSDRQGAASHLNQLMKSDNYNDTICAVSTAQGVGGIAVIRVSGSQALYIVDKVVRLPKDRQLTEVEAYHAVYGTFYDGVRDIDQIVALVFRAPRSFTGEDVVEISCHGSVYIQQEIVRVLIDNGCRLARPGEFTQRAFLNGKMDLSQAEAVADLISSRSKSAHRLALNQMKGGFSKELAELRGQLLKFTSLVELELDFSDHEDLEFADRTELKELAHKIEDKISSLAGSFSVGNAIKEGIPVAIVGETNAGKSTLLNAIVGEEKAIVSDIQGTTRDMIEDVVNINGVLYRFIDTAGLRQTTDTIENMGIERTYQTMDKAAVVLWIIDCQKVTEHIEWLAERIVKHSKGKKLLLVLNKSDKIEQEEKKALDNIFSTYDAPKIYISAKQGIALDDLRKMITEVAELPEVGDNDVTVTNMRHYEALKNALASIRRVNDGLASNISGDFLSQDLRECLQHIGEITGEITTDEVLGNIFKNFCIGK